MNQFKTQQNNNILGNPGQARKRKHTPPANSHQLLMEISSNDSCFSIIEQFSIIFFEQFVFIDRYIASCKNKYGFSLSVKKIQIPILQDPPNCGQGC